MPTNLKVRKYSIPLGTPYPSTACTQTKYLQEKIYRLNKSFTLLLL